MSDERQTRGKRNALYWAGWGLSGLAIAFFVLDATMKLLALSVVLQANAALGFEGADMARGLGVTLLVCTLLYAAPQTAVLGAILLTGYLGGAVAVHLRIWDPLFSDILSGVYGGLLVWGGLFLRDARVRALLPVRDVHAISRHGMCDG